MTRILVIGLDVGDGRLIREWGAQGHLPVLYSLITDGTWGWLGTTAETLHVSAWPSLYTGTLPGKHGVYYTFQPAPGQQGARRFAADQYGHPPFWQPLSTAGKRCIVFDAPYTHPQAHYDGIQIFEWGTWARYWQPMAMPAKLWRRLQHHCSAYPLGYEAQQIGLGALDPIDLQQRLCQAAAAKAKAAGWLMAQAPWDLFLLVFGETHPAAHYCWPAGQAATVSPTDASYVLLRRVYEAIDRAIGDLLAQLGDDVTVFLVSGDGIGPNYSGWHLLPEVLQRLGYTAVPQPADSEDGRAPQGGGSKDRLKTLRDLVPAEMRQTVSRYLPRRWQDAFMLRWATAGIDWSHTRAFCLPTDLEGCIRINLQGREPAGIIAPGEEYAKVCQELTASLLRLRNPLTDRPAVRRVIHADDALPGARRHYLPDLIVVWADEAAITELQAPEFGTVQAASPDARPGTHRPPGFVIARGPGVPQGHVLQDGHVVDVAPTILAAFGLSTPSQLDGRVWDELLAQ